MKGFPDRVDGPLGPWFKKVHEAVASVNVGDPREAVIECLGPPHEVRHHAVSAGQYGDKTPLPETLVYHDPYRPRRYYLFGIRAGVVHAAWQDTASRAAAGS
jgi:hypothetical protein